MSEFWEKTIQTYGTFIDYPQLTEKYLKRPPFKYLFQIFISLNTKTNFADGLFKNDELDPEFYDSPEKKMAFLKQLLKVVYKDLSKACPLKPQSVIKGVDCDKTNEFLQDMFVIATAKTGKPTVKETQNGSPESFPKSGSGTHGNSETSKDKTDIRNKESSSTGNSRPKVSKIVTQDTRELDVLETPPETLNPGKENIRDKSREQNVGKLTSQIREEQKKEERLLSKEGTDKKSSAENNIKMGTLGSGSQSQNKNAISAFNNSDKLNIDGKGPNFDNIKETIQKITQNAHPLGKLIEFVEDDLDGMSREHKKWQQLYAECAIKLEKLEQEQDEELQTYSDKLVELNEQIFEQENKIMSIRSRILKNSQKMDGMLAKIVHN